jgi:hypothetical protein
VCTRCKTETFPTDLSVYRDQCILSTNPYVRLEALSNHVERKWIDAVAGQTILIKFDRPFDIPYLAHCSCSILADRVIAHAKELYIDKTEMVVLTSIAIASEAQSGKTRVSWIVYGLNDIDTLPNWFIQFFAAASNFEHRLFKPALFDYAMSFEVFLETFLSERLADKFGVEAAGFILNRCWRVEDRSKEILELATGKRLSQEPEIFSAWDQNVRRPRNSLAHGELLNIGKDEAEAAHQATYQAIRWIESLK